MKIFFKTSKTKQLPKTEKFSIKPFDIFRSIRNNGFIHTIHNQPNTYILNSIINNNRFILLKQ